MNRHLALARMTSKALLAQLNEFATCDISDALLKLGVPSGGAIPDLQCFSTPGKILGPAHPVQMVAHASQMDPRPSEHYVDAAPLGSIILVNGPVNGKIYRNSSWGGLMTLGAKRREAKGVIVLGRVRDLKEHREEAFPVYALGHSTLPQAPFTRPSTIAQPISIPLPHLPSSPLVVSPGDLVMADEDGVVVIPLGQVSVEDVIREAGERARVDGLCADDIKAGMSIKDSFKSRRG